MSPDPAKQRLLRIVALSCAALALLAVLAFSVRWAKGRGAARAPFAELVEAVNGHPNRPLRGRVTGGFAYRPEAPAQTDLSGLRSSHDVIVATAALDDLARRSAHQLESAADFAVALLVHGQATNAVERLQDIREEDQTNARLLTDLSAAYLETARLADRQDDIVRSLDASERAIRANANSLEAHFNRALALELLSLPSQAEQAWRDYLEVERSPDWSREAGRRLGTLQARPAPKAARELLRRIAAAQPIDRASLAETVLLDPDEARSFVERELLPKWAETLQRGEDPSATLATWRALAGTLATVSGDRFLDDAGSAAERCSIARRHACLAATASGILELQRGLSRSQQFDFVGAVAPLRRARAQFSSSNPPLARWTEFNLAITSYYARDLDRAAVDLAAIENRLANAPYYHLLGRVASMRGLIDADRAAFDAALHHYGTAQALFARAREVDSELSTANLLADTLRVLGDFGAAWRVRLRMLTELHRLRPQRQEALLLATARLAESQGLFGAALHFNDAAVAIALASDGPPGRAQVLVRRAATYAELGDEARASADAEQVEQLLPSIGDANVRKRLEAELLVVKAGLATFERDAEGAIERALVFSQEAGLANYLPRLELLKGRQHLRRGRPDDAAAAFHRGIVHLETARLRTAATRLRMSYLDRSWALFGEMVALQLAEGNTDAAFDYAERGRARTIVDSLSDGDAPRASLLDLQSRLPPKTALLYYSTLDVGSVVWIIRQREASLVRLPLSRLELSRQVRQFQRRMRTGGPMERDAEALYDALVRPAADRLQQVRDLVVAADAELNAVPFAALRDRETGRYLLQDFVLTSSPNATLWLHGSRQFVPYRAVPESVSVISAPTSGETDLPELPGVVDEAREIAALYRTAALLPNSSTKADFIAALRQDGIVHFAGHAVSNVDYPELSRIILGPRGQDGTGVIYADELASTKGFLARLVVLSACSTGTGALSRGEGPISLARPLLIGGVRTVVASLWDVRDAGARELMVRFHRHLSAGAVVSEALRAAQLEMLETSDPALSASSVWAAFVVFGGSEQPSSPRASTHQ